MTLIHLFLCAECGDQVRCYDEWLKHLLSPKHKQLVQQQLSTGAWGPSEDERTLIVFGVKQKKSGFDIRAIDLLWHYSSQGVMVTDFYWDTSSMEYAVIQLESKEQAELKAGDHQSNILPGRRQLTVELKSNCRIILPEIKEMNATTSEQGVNAATKHPTPSATLSRITAPLTTNATTHSDSSEEVDNNIHSPRKPDIDRSTDGTQDKPGTSKVVEIVPLMQVPTGITVPSLSSAKGSNGASKTLKNKAKHSTGTSEPPTASVSLSQAVHQGKAQVALPLSVSASMCSTRSNSVSSSTSSQQQIPGPSKLSSQFHQNHKLMQQELEKVKVSLDQQLVRFYKTTLSGKEVTARETVINELTTILRKQYKQCKVEPFGSFLFGCCSSTSVVDVYVDLQGNTHENVDESIAQGDWEKMTALSNGFASTYSLITPIRLAGNWALNLKHAKTDIKLALQFGSNTFLSVRRSILIAFFTQLDPRVAPMLCLVRYWAKFYQLCSSAKLSKYGLDLMTITFLSSKGVIPSLHELKEMNRGGEIKVNGWNTAFTQDLEAAQNFLEWDLVTNESIPPLEMHEGSGLPTAKTLLLLFREWLDMYSRFDYENDMICALTSEFLRKSKFTSRGEAAINISSPALKLYWITGVKTPLNISSPLCIQDPFDLSCNVAVSTKLNTINEFKLCCKGTVERINALLANPFPVFFELFGEFSTSEDEKRTETAVLVLDGSSTNNKPKQEPKAPPNPSRPETPSQSCSPAPSHSRNSTAEVTFTPKNCHFKRKPLFFHCDRVPAEFGNVVQNESIYSLWLVLMEKFFLNVFVTAYKMKIISKQDTSKKPSTFVNGLPFKNGAKCAPNIGILVKAFSNFPFLKAGSTRKIVLRIEGEKIIAEKEAKALISNLSTNRSRPPAMSPLEFERHLCDETISQHNTKGTIQIYVTATIKLEELQSGVLNAAKIIVPRFIIEFSGDCPMGEFLASRFQSLVPEYLRYEFDTWMGQVFSS